MKYRLQLNTETQLFTVIDAKPHRSAEGVTIQDALKQIQK